MTCRNYVLLVGVIGCFGAGAPDPDPPLHLRILFIGNSLTYFNDLPRTLAGLALSAGDTIETASVAKPNFAVIDHANGMSNAVDVIRGSHWDFVVLQQGPTSEQLGRDTLILATRRLDPDIRAAGGRTAEMMTWPNDDDRNDFGEVRQSSQLAAEAVDGIFLPAGEAWRIAWTIDASLPLYGPDGFHPSPAGTYLAALVIYETLTGHPAEALPPSAVVNGQLLNLSSSIVRLLQRAAHEAVVRYPVTQSTNPSSRR